MSDKETVIGDLNVTMLDAKKVSEALLRCADGNGCMDGNFNPLCPYVSDYGCDMAQMMLDAHTLLEELTYIVKESEKSEYIWECPDCGSQLIIKTSNANEAIGIRLAVCPICGNKVLYGKAD